MKPRNKPKRVITPPDLNPKIRNKTFTIDSHGNSWTWCCGWFIINSRDGSLRTMNPLGHASFRRNITLATREDIHLRIGPRSRPNGLWRRVIDNPYEHAHTGRIGKIVATDGVHAIFLTRNEAGELYKTEVMFNNLNECKPCTKLPPKTKAKPVKKKPSLKKRADAHALLASLGIDLDSLIK
mgnify:CR=1 FL=1|tara:strand:+ start:1858 stop:2403 length:546 start_codon:yes stop_codon:yes gene_type:complete